METKLIAWLAACLAAAAAFGAEPMSTAEIVVDMASETGPVKPMNAVNNGPAIGAAMQMRGNFEEYRAAQIPFARIHDANWCSNYGAPHIVDIRAVFPNFDADENDPRSYDLVLTDRYLDNIRRAGTEVFFRLGESIEHTPKKYGVWPPKDFAKWARICEHVIRHYNEGWGWSEEPSATVKWSDQFKIKYWEIWNEPDLGNWRGTVTEFFQLYETAAKHLKKCFPEIKIGGPSITSNEDWARNFLAYCRNNDVPLDFFSWHMYATDPRKYREKASRFRKMLDESGYANAESILDEWNYVKGWRDDWVYSLEVESGRFNRKGAAFIAAAMADCQDAPVDMLMYYDARIGTVMNGIFDITTLWPLKGYYPFYAWAKLVDRGTQVSCAVGEGRGVKSYGAAGVVFDNPPRPVEDGQFRAVAAKGPDGSLAVFVARYAASNDVTDTGVVVLRVPGKNLARARCHVTDACRTYTEVPLIPQGNGSARIMMQPDSFALVEVD